MSNRIARVLVVLLLVVSINGQYALCEEGKTSREAEYTQCLVDAQIRYAEGIAASGASGAVTGAITGASGGGVGAVPGALTGFLLGTVGGAIGGIPAFADAVKKCEELLAQQ